MKSRQVLLNCASILFVFAAIFSAKAGVRFSSPVNTPLGYEELLTVADLDGDQTNDVIALDSRTVSVLLGDGNGGFKSTNTYGGGYIFSSVAAGDVNNDGKTDMVVLDSSLHTLRIYLGPGNPFGEPLVQPVSSGANTVTLADFNQDGRLDYMTANRSDGTVSVLIGDGKGGFLASQNTPVNGPWWATAVDLDGDLKLDIVTANLFTNSIAVVYGKGNGTFEPSVYYGVGKSPREVAFGDFDGDGRLDMACVNAEANSVTVRMQKGTRGFTSGTDYIVGNLPLSLVAADVNGDRIVDLVVGNYSSGDVTILLGTGDGTFVSAGAFASGGPVYSVGVGDVNHDGQIDICTANFSSAASVSVLLNQTLVSLSVVRQSEAVKLLWPAYAFAARPEFSFGLANWQTVTNPISPEGEWNSVIVPMSASQTFFRLNLN